MENYKKELEIKEKELIELYDNKKNIIEQIIKKADEIEELKKKYNIYDNEIDDEDVFKNIQPAQLDPIEENIEQPKKGRKGRKPKNQIEEQVINDDNSKDDDDENDDNSKDDNDDKDNEDDKENEEEEKKQEKPKRQYNKKTIKQESKPKTKRINNKK